MIMKILVIHSENDTEIVNHVRPHLESAKADIDTLPVQPQNSASGDIRKQFSAFFNSANLEGKENPPAEAITHTLIVSPVAQRWLDFLAGFSYGNRLPLLVYGEEAVAAIPVEFTSFFRSLNTEKSLSEYFRAENEAFEVWKNANEIIKARERLLQMGIPVTGESLANCAGEGSVQQVSLFLAAGFSPDTRNKAGVPLMNIAARKGNAEILALLIQSGAQLNSQADDRGTSALLDSVMCKHYSLAEDLIKAGAALDIKSKDGQTALVVAVGAEHEKTVEALIKAGANPDIADSMGVSARSYAKLFKKSGIIALFDTYTPQNAGNQ